MILIFFSFCFYLINAEQAPASMTMSISFEHDAPANPWTRILMKIVIHSVDSKTSENIYEEENELKQRLYQNKKFELKISFPLDDINQPLSFKGFLKVKSGDSEEVFEFKSDFKFDRKSLKYNKGGFYMPMTFFHTQLTHYLDIIITTNCKDNYYPINTCNKFCIKTQNTNHCDENGNKICNKGYYFKPIDQLCHNDWCFNSANKCLNSGTCINMQYRFECQCTISYKGTYCEEYNDLCLKFICPNGTTCSVENEKVNCQSKFLPAKTSPPRNNDSLSLSIMIMIAFAVFIVFIAIGLCVTIWACKNPKNVEYKYSDEIDSFKTPPYYNCSNNERTLPSLHLPSRENISYEYKFNNVQNHWNHLEPNDYYSLRLINDRNGSRINKTHNNHNIYRSMGRQSLPLIMSSASSMQGDDCDNLPLPPPIESENFENDTLFL